MIFEKSALVKTFVFLVLDTIFVVFLVNFDSTGVKTQDTRSQEVYNARVGFQQYQTNYNTNKIAAAGTEQYQDYDLVDVKQYQRIHVLQYSIRGKLIGEYEEERLAEYQYQLEIDICNQLEYSSKYENNELKFN
ncbi:hypothetical protein RCL_jg12256.t1 [Rhizophagus clarus]|uniref:Uncharacterized protein n=1 Tax=Rhizophagus clarus TaxID=94130 RepID=A0A8H3QFS3_9GLOM|nr:hypothetical protein RCL_jg12256.t1 [Rhizophagus clarus]